MVIDYSEPYKDEIHNLLVKYGLSWTHSPAGIEFYKMGVDDTCNIAGYFTKKEYDKLVNWINRNNISEEIRMMLNSPLGGRRGIGFGLGRSWQRKAAGEDWWLAGGIPAANCIAAYQPKGAASYAASKINLANPGTYDAVETSLAITWDATNGWQFIEGSSKYLDTGYVPTLRTSSMIVKFKNQNSVIDTQGICGATNGISTTTIALSGKWSTNQTMYGNGAIRGQSPHTLSGVMAMAGKDFYIDAVYQATCGDGSGALSNSVHIGNINGSGYYSATVDVLAFALYNTAITSAQISAVTTAMNVL